MASNVGALGEADDLEQLAHLVLGDQLLGCGAARAGRASPSTVEQAAVHQEARLRGVAQHVEPGVLAGQRDGAEVDMRGDVLVADVDQRVGVGQVGAVAHQRAALALRVVVLGLGETVVDEEGRAAPQRGGQRAHEGLGLRVDLGHGAGHEGPVDRRAQRRSGGRPRRSRRRPAPTPRSNQRGRRSAAAAPASRRAPRCRPPRRRMCSGRPSTQARGRRTAPAARAGARAASPTGRRWCSAAPGRRARRAAARPARPSRRRTPRPRRCRWRRAPARTCAASARPNSGDSSGAVTKSLPEDGIVPNLRLSRA